MRTALKTLAVISFFCIALTSGTKEKDVYICTGKSSVAYHCDLNCKGLNNCKSGIKTVTLKKAKKIGRRACKICY